MYFVKFVLLKSFSSFFSISRRLLFVFFIFFQTKNHLNPLDPSNSLLACHVTWWGWLPNFIALLYLLLIQLTHNPFHFLFLTTLQNLTPPKRRFLLIIHANHFLGKLAQFLYNKNSITWIEFNHFHDQQNRLYLKKKMKTSNYHNTQNFKTPRHSC